MQLSLFPASGLAVTLTVVDEEPEPDEAPLLTVIPGQLELFADLDLFAAEDAA